MSVNIGSGWLDPEKAETSAEPFEGFREWQWPLDLVESNRLLANRILMMTVLLTALFLGLPGNILVIVSIAFVKNLRKVPHLFVVNLAVADLGGLVRNCFILTGVFYGDTVLPKHETLCGISGMVCILACFGSLWTMMFIAINRFMFICKNEIYKKVFNLKGTIVCIVLIWACTLVLDSPSLAGLGGHSYNGLYLFCGYEQGGAPWFNASFYTVLALCVPMAVITFCYAQIWRTASQSSGTLGQMSKRRRQEQKQLLVSLATIYVTFLITWFPYAFLILIMGLKIDFYSFMPLELLLILDLWAHLNSSMNFFIYGVTHSGFRRAYKQILSKILPCYNPDLSTDSKSQQSSASRGGTGGGGSGGGYYKQKNGRDKDNSQTQLTTT